MKGIERGDMVEYIFDWVTGGTEKRTVTGFYSPFGDSKSDEIELDGEFSVYMNRVVSVECRQGHRKLYRKSDKGYFCPFCKG